jgi:cytochrome c
METGHRLNGGRNRSRREEMMDRRRARIALWTVALALATWSCGGGDGGADAGDGGEAGVEAGESTGDSGLTAEEMENGIGPVRSVELGDLDAALAERGENRFQTLCYACHRLEERYVAPKLGDVLERRTPEYVMNMILNPVEMTARHPEARALLAEFMTQMPDQGLTEEDARAIVEYIRSEAAGGGGEGDQDEGSEG